MGKKGMEVISEDYYLKLFFVVAEWLVLEICSALDICLAYKGLGWVAVRPKPRPVSMSREFSADARD